VFWSSHRYRAHPPSSIDLAFRPAIGSDRRPLAQCSTPTRLSGLHTPSRRLKQTLTSGPNSPVGRDLDRAQPRTLSGSTARGCRATMLPITDRNGLRAVRPTGMRRGFAALVKPARPSRSNERVLISGERGAARAARGVRPGSSIDVWRARAAQCPYRARCKSAEPGQLRKKRRRISRLTYLYPRRPVDYTFLSGRARASVFFGPFPSGSFPSSAVSGLSRITARRRLSRAHLRLPLALR